MFPHSHQSKGNEPADETYPVKKLERRKDLQPIIDFLLSEDSFDDRNFTKGELMQLKDLPNNCLKKAGLQFWYAESRESEIVGVISLRENEQKTGGYIIDYVAVHRLYRMRGIAWRLMDVVFKYVQQAQGRYLRVDTCDTSLYEDARRLFAKTGFSPVGHLSDYYFAGEGMIIYQMKM